MEDRTYKALDAVFSGGTILDQARLRALNKGFRNDHLHSTEQTRREMYQDRNTGKYICERGGWQFVKQPEVIEEECKKSLWMHDPNFFLSYKENPDVFISGQSKDLFNKYFTKSKDSYMLEGTELIRTTLHELKAAIKRGLFHDALTRFITTNNIGTYVRVFIPNLALHDFSFFKNEPFWGLHDYYEKVPLWKF